MVAILDARSDSAHRPFLGVSPCERLLRQLARINDIERVHLIVSDAAAARLMHPTPARPSLAVLAHAAEELELPGGLVLVLAADVLIDARILSTLASRRFPARVAMAGRTVAAVVDGVSARRLLEGVEPPGLEPLDLAAIDTYIGSMRRSIPLHVLPAPVDAQSARAARRILLDASQSGALDLPAQWIHRPIELALAPHVAELPVTPNQLTALGLVLGVLATWMFASGAVALGLSIAMVYGVVDGLDGKQARLKVETSPAGEMEHLADYVVETSWWVALAWTVLGRGDSGAPVACAVLVGCDLLTRWGSGFFRRRAGRPIDDWSRWDRAARAVAGRRNIYVWGLAVGLAGGVSLPAAYRALALWSAATAFHRWSRIGWMLGRAR